MTEVIHVHVFDPERSLFKSSGNNKSEIHTYTCEKASVCDAHKNGKCIMIGNFLGPKCFGKKSIKQGPTKRAKSFGSFIESGKSHEKYKALSRQPEKIFKIGDGYLMPYPHIDMLEISPFEKKSSAFISGFPFLENPTPEKLSIIYQQKPHALFGGEIKSYQKEVVPEIVRHISDSYPELYEMLLSKEPEIKARFETFDYTGKKALIKTLLPGNITISNNDWYWDGEHLTGEGSNMTFAPVEAAEVRVTPKDDAECKVSDTKMVGPDTVIID